MKINYKKLGLFIFVPLVLGAIVSFLTSGSTIDSKIPAWIFPVVWSILYVLMGISSYLIYRDTGKILRIYIIQLIFNLLWSFVFFNFKLFTLSFVWIILLILMVIIMIRDFAKVNKIAGYLQIPYLLWLFVALYLSSTFVF